MLISRNDLNPFKAHQYLALLRGERQKALKISWDLYMPASLKKYEYSNAITNEFGKKFLQDRVLRSEIFNLLESKLAAYFKKKLKSDKEKKYLP